ncbi:peptidase M42 [candidate division LCP-89 bacterium B3_LCP]|uniref:Peptidase M42 n=1 Tax=candidate division LCP-89 bacterium B3_LCP TaxID=2012998 RepID=A0A532V3Q5_UNCL8|nr:MAG: peptidase M42 [candidate division LCP-89 bacterium B3_LCP]
MELKKLLKDLCNAFGPSGFEEDVRALIREQVEPIADKVEEDALGNMTAWKKGESDRVVLIDAHTDEVGIMISHVDDKGFLRFATLGGWDARQFPGTRVTLKTKSGFVPGAIGFTPPHITKPEERSKAIPTENLAIDIGVKSKDEAAELGIVPGTPGILDGPFVSLPGNRAMAKAFDDRAGCAAAIKVMEEFSDTKLPFTLAVNFATSEELGLRGAKVSSYRIAPEIALVLETTTAGDFPGVPGHLSPCIMSDGVALTVADRTMLTSPKMLRFLQEVAQKNEIPHQLKQPLFGGTNAGEIHLSRSGVLTGVLAVPGRYIHGPSSVIDLHDLDCMIKLAIAAIKEIPKRLM